MNNNSTAYTYRFASLVCSVLSLVFFFGGWIRLDLGFASHSYTVFKTTDVLKALSSIISNGTYDFFVFLLKFFSIIAIIETAFSILYAIIPITRFSPKRLSFSSTYITAAFLCLGMLYVNSEAGDTVLLPTVNMILSIVFAIISTFVYGKYYPLATADSKNIKKEVQAAFVCPKCKNSLDKPLNFCPHCGSPIPPSNNNNQ